MKGSNYGMKPEKAAEIFGGGDNKLKALRIKKGYSQHDLSVASGVTKRSIQYYEQHDHSINLAKLEAICDLCIALDCKIEDILEEDDVMRKFKLVK